MALPPPEFALPSLEGPLDLEERLAALPPGSQARGFLFSEAVKYFGIRDGPRYLPFQNYPAEDYLRLVAHAAGEHSPKRRLFGLGRKMFGHVALTAAGRVAMALVGNDPAAMVAAGERSLRMVSLRGTLEVVDGGPRYSRFRVQRIWSFPSFVCGCSHGAFEMMQVDPRVYVHIMGISTAEHFVTW